MRTSSSIRPRQAATGAIGFALWLIALALSILDAPEWIGWTAFIVGIGLLITGLLWWVVDPKDGSGSVLRKSAFPNVRIDAPHREDRPRADDSEEEPFEIAVQILITNRETSAPVSLDFALRAYKGEERLAYLDPIDRDAVPIDVPAGRTIPRTSLRFKLDRSFADELLEDAEVLCEHCGWKHFPDDAFRLRVIDRLSDTEAEFLVPGSYPPGALGQSYVNEVRIGDNAAIARLGDVHEHRNRP